MEKEKKEVYVAPDFVVYEMEYEGALLSGSGIGGGEFESEGGGSLYPDDKEVNRFDLRNREIGWD